MKTCNGCSECCLSCSHRIETGCNIYSERPDSCKAYECLWIITNLPDTLRPDKCFVILQSAPDESIIAQTTAEDILGEEITQYLTELDKILKVWLIKMVIKPWKEKEN